MRQALGKDEQCFPLSVSLCFGRALQHRVWALDLSLAAILFSLDEDGASELSESLELSWNGRRPLWVALWLCCMPTRSSLSDHPYRLNRKNSWTNWLGHGGAIGRMAAANFAACSF